jgi:hypothetical protein
VEDDLPGEVPHQEAVRDAGRRFRMKCARALSLQRGLAGCPQDKLLYVAT